MKMPLARGSRSAGEVRCAAHGNPGESAICSLAERLSFSREKWGGGRTSKAYAEWLLSHM